MSQLRRTRLYVPGNNPHLIENCYLYGADCLIFDLEDSVAPDRKLEARILVKQALQTLDLGKVEKMVRINTLAEGGLADLEEVVPAGVDTVVLPKTESLDEIKEVEKILMRLEGKRKVLILPIIETIRGLYNAPYISNHDRVPALSWGAEDLTAQIGVPRSEAGDLLKSVRIRIVLAAKLHAKQALDTVFSDITDEEGLYKSAVEARHMGFDGKGVIHPSQIEIIHSAFTPSEEELDRAKKIIKAMKESKGGVASLDGKMLDKPVLERARKIVALAKSGGGR